MQGSSLDDAPRAYSLDEIALVPSRRTVDPDDVSIEWELDGTKFDLPMMGAAMDSAVSPARAIEIGQLGGLGVLNLEGLWTRYEDTDSVLEEISRLEPGKDTHRLRELYAEPIKPELVTARVQQMKTGDVYVAASLTPQRVLDYYLAALEGGLDMLVVQGTVVSADHVSSRQTPLNLYELVKRVQGDGINVILGNGASYEVVRNLMKTGACGVLVGVGPGEGCTSREVLGVGVGMATAISEAARARSDHQDETGRYCQIIADGGFSKGGQIAKAIACRANAVMIGSPLARTVGAPGRGYHWGMAAPDPRLPRGVRVQASPLGSLEEVLIGPAVDNTGRTNLFGALRASMATLGHKDLREMRRAKVVRDPNVRFEGKSLQQAQGLGMHG